MSKEIYTPQEQYLIEAMKLHEATTTALELDLLLLEMEKHFDLMDGLKEEAWLL